MTARIPAEALAAAAAATEVRNQKGAEFTTAAGTATHAASIAIGVTEEEAAQASQAATGAALTIAQAVIAGADATHPTA